jgi:hypothetical protein
VAGVRSVYDVLNDPAQLVNIDRTADATLLARLDELSSRLATCASASCRSREDAPAP